MRGENLRVIGKSEKFLVKTAVQQRGKLLWRVVRGEIGASHVTDEESVAREDGLRPVWGAEIGHPDGHTFDGMAGSLQKLEETASKPDRIAVFDGRVREGGAGLFAKVDSCARPLRKFTMSGDEVGVEMSFNDVLDLEPFLRGGFEIDVDVPLRVDHGGNTLRTDKVRSVSEAAQIKMLNLHSFHDAFQ